MTCVVDASVAAKWVVPEPDSALAQALLDEALIVPDLLFAEVGNILWKKQTRGELSTGAAQLGVRWLLQVPLQVHDSASLLVDGLALALPAKPARRWSLPTRDSMRVVTPPTRQNWRRWCACSTRADAKVDSPRNGQRGTWPTAGSPPLRYRRGAQPC